jgi:hypothetical protein
MTREQLEQSFTVTETTLTNALQRLCTDGRVVHADGVWVAQSFEVPVGTEEGWEAAVCDHFRAVANAIGKKLATRGSQSNDTIGGATLTFSVHPAHPNQAEVYGLLQRIRGDVGQLWNTVADHNRQYPPPPDADRVTFYFGQNITPHAQEGVESPSPEVSDVESA